MEYASLEIFHAKFHTGIKGIGEADILCKGAVNNFKIEKLDPSLVQLKISPKGLKNLTKSTLGKLALLELQKLYDNLRTVQVYRITLYNSKKNNSFKSNCNWGNASFFFFTIK